jgi:protein subunit release factor B
MNEERQRVTIASKKDFDVSYFCGSGAGGQARNKVATGVQIIHRESGAMGRASDSRSQEQNKRAAFERLLADPRMKFWISQRVYEVRAGEKMEETIARETQPEHFKYEIKNAEGKWEEVDDSYFSTPAAME